MKEVIKASNKKKHFQQSILQTLRNHAQIIDSLVGLPEVVGKQLFDFFEEDGVFAQLSAHSSHVLQVFAEAFGAELLNVFVCHSHHILSDQLDYLNAYLLCITCLDLSHCHLGSCHEVFPMIAKSPSVYLKKAILFNCHVLTVSCVHIFDSLESLFLRSCSLTDTSMRNMSLSSSLHLRKGSNITVCDLSGNPKLTSKAYSSLARFSSLKIIVLSLDQQDLLKALKQRHFLPEKIDLKIPRIEGWASVKLAAAWRNNNLATTQVWITQAWVREIVPGIKRPEPPRKVPALPLNVEDMLMDSD